MSRKSHMLVTLALASVSCLAVVTATPASADTAKPPKQVVPRRTADINRDGIVNLFDLLAFQSAMGHGSLAADYAPAWGKLDVFDWLAFNKMYTEQYGRIVR